MSEEKKVTEMSKERQGEIAILCLKHILRKKGFMVNDQIKREIGNQAKEIGVEPEELKAFLRPLVREILDKALE